MALCVSIVAPDDFDSFGSREIKKSCFKESHRETALNTHIVWWAVGQPEKTSESAWTLLATLEEVFHVVLECIFFYGEKGVLPYILEVKIKDIQSDAALRNLSRKIVKINDVKEFQKLLNQVTDH